LFKDCGATANDELLKKKKMAVTHAHASYAFSQAIIYDDECSCGLYPNCTSQAYFSEENSSEMNPK
jgi:hypothetical protein